MKQAKSKKQVVELSEQEALTRLLGDKFNAIDPNKVVFVGTNSQGENVYRIAGKKLSPNQASLLRNEAQMIQKMQLWKVITETLKNTARLKMFEKSESFDDMRYGKAMLYNCDVMEQIVNKLAEVPTEQPKPHVYEPRPKAL
jgi:hypothetical protein